MLIYGGHESAPHSLVPGPEAVSWVGKPSACKMSFVFGLSDGASCLKVNSAFPAGINNNNYIKL